MSEKHLQVTPLESRKQLLTTESELNRTHLIEEWQVMSLGVHALGARVKSISSLASAAALLATGLSVFRRGRASSRGAKSSWLQIALKGAQVAGSIWLAIRSRPMSAED